MFLSQRSNVGELLPTSIKDLLIRLSQELSCPICLCVFTNPMQTSCLHAFCKPCIERALRQVGPDNETVTARARKCPVCKAVIGTKRALVEAVEVAALVEAFNGMCAAYQEQYGHAYDLAQEVWEKLDELIYERERTLDKLCNVENSKDTPDTMMVIPSSPDPFLFQSVPVESFGEEEAIIDQNRDDENAIKKERKEKKGNIALKSQVKKNENPKEKKSTKSRIIHDDSQKVIHYTSITTSNLKKEEQFIKQFAQQRNIPLSDNIVDSSTLLIMPTRSEGVVKRTFKYMMAVLKGCPVVSYDFVTDSATDPRGYLVHGDEYNSNDIIRTCLLKHSKGEAPLFSTLKVYLYGLFDRPSKEDVIALVKAGGGTVIDSVEKLCRGCVVVCDAGLTGSFEKDAGVIAKYRPIINVTWLFACISSLQIVDKRDFCVL